MNLFPLTTRVLNLLPGRACSGVESASILRILAGCVEAAVAMPPMLAAWAASQRHHQAGRVVQLAERLSAGEPLESVVAGERSTLLDEHAAAVQFGTQTGLLPQMVAVTVNRQASLSLRYRVAIGYLVVVLVMFLATAGFLSLRIVPIYAKIVDDFGMERPPSLQLAFAVSGPVALVSSLLPLLIIFGVLLLVSRRLRRWAAWPFQRGQRAFAAVDLLSVAVAGGMPLDVAARQLAACQRDRRLAQKLDLIAKEDSSVTLARLIGRVPAEQFFRLSSSGDRGWLLHAVATRRRERRRRRWTLTAELLVPVGVFLMGVLVLIESLAVLGPLNELVGGLS